MTGPDTPTGQAVFGAADGSTSAVGALAGLLISHAAPATVLVAAVGLGVAAGTGMSAGSWLSGTRVRLALILGCATAIGTVLPALPLVFAPARVGLAIALIVLAGVAAAIAEVRARTHRRLPAYVASFATLAVAAGLSVAASLLLGAVG